MYDSYANTLEVPAGTMLERDKHMLVLCKPQHVAGKSQGEEERRQENNMQKVLNKDTWLYLFNAKGCPEKRNSQGPSQRGKKPPNPKTKPSSPSVLPGKCCCGFCASSFPSILTLEWRAGKLKKTAQPFSSNNKTLVSSSPQFSKIPDLSTHC